MVNTMSEPTTSPFPEEVYIDLANIPLKPIGKKEISQLEIALIIGTLYRPEILELIRDPIERSTWMDSLAIAAAAFARHKAGIPVSQIAEELGRSEASIRSHLAGKTKAGKLVQETYEKIKSGQLKLLFPFVKVPVAGREEEVKALRSEIEKLRERVRSLEEEVEQLRKERDALKVALSEREEKLTSIDAELKSIRAELEKTIKDRDELNAKYSTLVEKVREVKSILENTIKLLSELS